MRNDRPPWGFRPRNDKVAERLEYANTLGLKRGDVVNTVLEKNLSDIDHLIEGRKKELKKLIATTAP